MRLSPVSNGARVGEIDTANFEEFQFYALG